MKVKDVVGECLIKMGKDNFLDEAALDDEQNGLKNKLLCAVNIAYREALSLYLPPICSESVTFKMGKCSANSLEKSILYPIKVERDGERKSFRGVGDVIFCDIEGVATLTYAYMPEGTLKMEDEIKDMRLTPGALSDGALGEYYFQNKVFELAKNFDTSFRAQMSVLKNAGRSIRLKKGSLFI